MVPLTSQTNASLGGKAAGLSRLLGAEARVPPTVVIPHQAELEPALEEALGWFQDPKAIKSYAVRSSGLGEDGHQKSFAGQLDSFLRVKGKAALADAVAACRASGANDRVRSYAGQAIPVSVIVQQMVEADFAGVLFTCDPVSGSRNHLVLEAISGTAEHLVEGTVAATTFVFDRKGRLQTRQGPELAFDAAAVTLRALELERSLGDEQPLDFEWALVGGELWWLQVRPATAFGCSGPEAHLLAPGEAPRVGPEEVHWTSVNAREALPGVVTPITQDLCRTMIEAGMSAMAERLGAVLPPDPVVDFFDGRAYLSITGFFKMARSLPLENPEALIHQLLTGASEQARFRFRFSLIPRLLRLGYEILTLGRRFEELERRELNYFDYLSDPRERSTEDLLSTLEELLEMRVLFSYHALGSGVYSNFYSLLEDLCQSYGETASDTLQGLGSLRFGASAAALRELASVAPVEVVEDPSLLPRFPAFRKAFERFLAEYGHLGSVSLEPAQAPWRERPEQVLKLVAGLLKQGQTQGRAAYLSELRKRRAAAVERIASKLPWWFRWRFRLMLSWLQWAAPFRENLKFMGHRRLAIARGYLLELGRRRWPEDPERIFFLRRAEILQNTGTDEVIEARRRAHRKAQRAGYPLHRVEGPGGVRVYYPAGHKGDELRGLGASAGVVTGRARVIRSLEEADRLQPGEILVTTATDPCWTPLFSLAAGVVVEIGNTLSHGSVVAREVGIPAVIGIPGLVSQIRDGEELLVDGSRGLVRRLAHTV